MGTQTTAVRAQTRSLVALALLAFACSLSLACVGAEGGGSANTTGLTTDNAIPTANDGGSSSTNTGGGGSTATGGAGQAASLDGVSLRWRNDMRRCLARTTLTPTQNDPVVMATCSSDARQAFYTISSTFGVGGGMCLAANGNGGPLFIDSCSNSNTVLWLSVSGDIVQTLGLGPQGFLVPSDSAGTVGKAVTLTQSTPTSAAQGTWDMVGVGNVGGAMIAVYNNPPVFCLAKSGSGVALAPCDRSVPEQRWRMDAGFLVNDTGECLTCTPSQQTCGFQSCASATQTTANDQRWRSHLYLQYIGDGKSVYFLGGETTSRVVSIGGSTASVWSFGGKVQ